MFCSWLISILVLQVYAFLFVLTFQGPHSQILMTGGGVPQRFIFYTKKITTSEFVYPKKPLHFLAYPKKSPQFFFATQKNAGVFHRPPKNHLWPNFSDSIKNNGPPVIKICEWGPWDLPYYHLFSRNFNFVNLD